jgi:pimeloyl-ACP methyl ester carboxylesterase
MTAAPALRKTWRYVARLVGAAMLFYAAVLALLWWKQETLLFVPEVLAADHRFDRGDDVQDLWIDVPGARLHALHLRRPQPRGVVFFLHGNGGSLDSWFVNLDFYRRSNVDLVMLDYRGYGKSSGRIDSEAQLHADVRATWDVIAPRYAGLHRVVLGRSLGTGLAAALAAEVQPEATVLVSPYFSMQALAAEHYPWVPGALLRYPLRTDLVLPRLRGPVLLVHGERDRLIDLSHSERLKALLPRARLVVVAAAAHNDLQRFPAYSEALAAALPP